MPDRRRITAAAGERLHGDQRRPLLVGRRGRQDRGARSPLAPSSSRSRIGMELRRRDGPMSRGRRLERIEKATSAWLSRRRREERRRWALFSFCFCHKVKGNEEGFFTGGHAVRIRGAAHLRIYKGRAFAGASCGEREGPGRGGQVVTEPNVGNGVALPTRATAT